MLLNNSFRVERTSRGMCRGAPVVPSRGNTMHRIFLHHFEEVSSATTSTALQLFEVKLIILAFAPVSVNSAEVHM